MSTPPPLFIHFIQVPRVASFAIKQFVSKWGKATRREVVEHAPSLCDGARYDHVVLQQQRRQRGAAGIVLVSREPLCESVEWKVDVQVFVFRDPIARVQSYLAAVQSRASCPDAWRNRTLSSLVLSPPDEETIRVLKYQATLQTRLLCGSTCFTSAVNMTTLALQKLQRAAVVVAMEDVNYELFTQLSHALGGEQVPDSVLPAITHFVNANARPSEEVLSSRALEELKRWTRMDAELVALARVKQQAITRAAIACADRYDKAAPPHECRSSNIDQLPPGRCRAESKRALCPGKRGAVIQYVHIPKTGGTTVEQFLSEWSRDNAQSYFRYDYRARPRCNFGGAQGFRGTYTGHRVLGVCEDFIKAHKQQQLALAMVTVRNPIERFVSNFDYVMAFSQQRDTFHREQHAWRNRKLNDLILGANEDEFTLTKFKQWAWHQTRHICGVNCPTHNSSLIMQRVRSNIEDMDVIADVAQLDDFLVQFQYHVGNVRQRPLVFGRRENAGNQNGSVRSSVLSEAALRRLREWSAMDLETYVLAKQASVRLTARARECIKI